MRAGSRGGRNSPHLGRWEKRLSPGCWGGGAAAPHSSQVRGTPRSLRLRSERHPGSAACPPPPTWHRAPANSVLASLSPTLLFAGSSPGLSRAVVQPRPPKRGAPCCGPPGSCTRPASPCVSVSGSPRPGSASRPLPASPFSFCCADTLSQPCSPGRFPGMRLHPSGVGLLPSPLPRLRFCGLTPNPALCRVLSTFHLLTRSPMCSCSQMPAFFNSPPLPCFISHHR